MGMDLFSHGNEFRQKTLKLQTAPIKGIFFFQWRPEKQMEGKVTVGNKGGDADRCIQRQ